MTTLTFQLLFFVFGAISIWLSYRSYRSGRDYLAYVRSELAKPVPDAFGPTVVILPCRGAETGLLENLRAVASQDHPDHRVLFVVDDVADAAVPAIRKVMDEFPNTQMIIAPKAANAGQKVENIREALLAVGPDTAAVAFADSDGRPHPHWLRYLTAPLADETVGAATGYRWFIAERQTLSSELLAAWNASIASALGPRRRSNFCWGGATAMRRSDIEQWQIRERLGGTLSDDFIIAETVLSSGSEIHFVPQALTPSRGDTTFFGLLEFTTRQMKITHVYAPHLWRLSLIGSFIFTAVMAAAVIQLTAGDLLQQAGAVILLIAVVGFSVLKARDRLRAVMAAMSPSAEKLRRQILPQCILWPAATILFFFNCTAGIFSRTIVWRGIKYKMISKKETEIL